MSNRTLCMSYGGGWQSVTMCVLVGEGILPRPDLAGIADTSREVQTTWDYLHNVIQPYLDAKVPGLKIEVIPHTLSYVDLYDNNHGLTLIPAFTRTIKEIKHGLYEDREIREGRLPTFCSGKWKQEVMMRWYRTKGVVECDQWIGYSLDEADRRSEDRKKWCHNVFPLIEKGITRAMCAKIIERAGLPMPKKSRCWMCPHQNEEEWREVQSRPDEFAAAIRLEEEINASDPDGDGDLFLYAGRIPLALADFNANAALPPARPCQSSSCWT